MNRGVDRMDVFNDADDRRRFLGLLAEAAAGAGGEVAAFCLVRNHFHLLLHCPTGGVSRVMMKLGSDYARAFNRRHGRDGPLFRSRFASRLVDSDEYLVTLVRYIHRNSLDLGIAPAHWPWSSYSAYVGESRAPSWLEIGLPLAIIGGPEAHRVHVNAQLDADKRVGFSQDPDSLHRSASAVADLVADVADVLGGLSNPLDPAQRAAATILVLVEACELRPAQLVEVLQSNSPSSIRSRVARARLRAEHDPTLAAAVAAAVEILRGRRAA